jgi:hypothetical protein
MAFVNVGSFAVGESAAVHSQLTIFVSHGTSL